MLRKVQDIDDHDHDDEQEDDVDDNDIWPYTKAR